MSETLQRYRKKPVVIEAVQFDGTAKSACDVLDVFGGEALRSAGIKFEPRQSLDMGVMIIPTLEGDHTASPGDWIIKGVKGEFYPCKPDIFAATYELESVGAAAQRRIEELEKLVREWQHKFHGDVMSSTKLQCYAGEGELPVEERKICNLCERTNAALGKRE